MTFCKGIQERFLWFDSFVFPRPLWDTKATSFSIYNKLISEFTSRALSNPGDSVRAISGIMNLWRQHFLEKFDNIGLPTNMMDVALLLKPTEVFTYRTDPNTHQHPFPSWCWAGWKGEVEYRSVINACERTLSMVSWDPNPDQYEHLKQDLETRLATTVTQPDSSITP